jgi:RimJ/RimL family protein N-acetyltransferase
VRSRSPHVRIRIRELGPDEDDVLDRILAGLSPTSRWSRYLTSLTRLTPALRAALLAVDGDRHVAFVAEVGRGARRTPVGLARYVVDGPDRAEVAYEVVDAWQGRGVGDRLVATLVRTAHERGIAELHATVLADNAPSLTLLRRHLPTLRVVPEAGLLEARGTLRAGGLETFEVYDDLAIA